MLILDVHDIKALLNKVGFKPFFKELIDLLESDFKRWEEFDKMARVATHYEHGVLELMPASDDEIYGYKYVTGHPKNPDVMKTTVMATGQLSTVDTGEPILISEMTLLTALRTGATSALAGKYLARKNSKVLCLIGTGAQSEFQSLAFDTVFDIEEIRYYDVDPKAMDKFERNMASFEYNMTRCKDTAEAVKGADIVTTITADKRNQTIILPEMVEEGVLLNGVGGDCPGKTEMAKEVVENVDLVAIEYYPQTKVEGEIQQVADDFPTTELWEIILGQKEGRTSDKQTILFDSVGFGVEDVATLKLAYKLAKENNIGRELDLIPNMGNDPKDLFKSFL